MDIELTSLADTARLATCLATCMGKHVQPPASIWLQGQLGVGKTAFCREFIHSFDASARVKSPTYTILESYPIAEFVIHHFDFYRITQADELEYIGIRDHLSDKAICLIEWPEHAYGVALPSPQLSLRFDYTEDEGARRVNLQGEDALLQNIQQAYD